MLAMEIGLSIDLAQAERAVKGAGRARLPAVRNPAGLDWSSPPLTLEQDAPDLVVAGRRLAASVQVRVFDFGAVSISYRIPFEGTAAAMLELSLGLSNNQALLADGRSRAEAGPLGEQEVRDALSATVSYGPADLAVIDWNAALLFDAEPQASLDVLEFANVELLEFRTLDEQLDHALAESWGSVREQGATGVQRGRRRLQRLADLQMDAAILYEEINNALKLLGDQFLARLYRVANRRMHLDEWERSTLRKLETLESIYEKLAQEQAHRRAELLEWIIILLISAEIAFSVITFLRH